MWIGELLEVVQLPHVSEQLELELAGPGRAWYEPWGGKSPRGLTKAAKRVSLVALPARGLREYEYRRPEREYLQLELQLEAPSSSLKGGR